MGTGGGGGTTFWVVAGVWVFVCGRARMGCCCFESEDVVDWYYATAMSMAEMLDELYKVCA